MGRLQTKEKHATGGDLTQWMTDEIIDELDEEEEDRGITRHKTFFEEISCYGDIETSQK